MLFRVAQSTKLLIKKRAWDHISRSFLIWAKAAYHKSIVFFCLCRAFCRFCAVFCVGAAYDDVIIGSAVAVYEDGARFVRVVLFGAVNGFDVKEDGVTGLTGYWEGAFPGPFVVCKSQVREGVDVVELPQFVRARYDVEGAVFEVGRYDVGEDANGSFVPVFKIRRVLVQVFGMASDGFFVEALPIAVEFDVGAENGFDNVEGGRVKCRAKEGRAGVVVDAQDHDLSVAFIIFRRGYKEGVVGRAPSFGDCRGLIEKGKRLPGSGFDVAVKRVNVFAEQAPHDNRAMRFECLSSTLGVDVFGLEVQVV